MSNPPGFLEEHRARKPGQNRTPDEGGAGLGVLKSDPVCRDDHSSQWVVTCGAKWSYRSNNMCLREILLQKCKAALIF